MRHWPNMPYDRSGPKRDPGPDARFAPAHLERAAGSSDGSARRAAGTWATEHAEPLVVQMRTAGPYCVWNCSGFIPPKAGWALAGGVPPSATIRARASSLAAPCGSSFR